MLFKEIYTPAYIGRLLMLYNICSVFGVYFCWTLLSSFVPAFTLIGVSLRYLLPTKMVQRHQDVFN